MGVHGLTTFIKENSRSLSHTLELKGNYVSSNGSGSMNLVVDGWSLIFAVLCNSGEPWVFGGEYAALGRHVEAIVSAWISVGIRPTFVFDGPAPPLKYPTIVSRLQNNCVKPANLFFRTSPAARSAPRSLAEARIAPPLGYQVIVSVLLSMAPLVNVEFADGEADPYIVALAGRLGAYVSGNDSDFLILNCEGYKGYIPLEEMTWIASLKEQDAHPPDPFVLDEVDGFQYRTVMKKKQKRKYQAKESRSTLGNGILPPSLPIESDTTLLLRVYEPTTFAQHVSLPPSLLPLLGALVGNDYAAFDFFRFTEPAAQRVKRVANTLSSVLTEVKSGNGRKIRKINRGGQDGVLDVIGTTVERLLLWRDPVNPPASGRIDKITEMVVQSTLEYALDSSMLPQGTQGGHQNDSNGRNSPGRYVRSPTEEVYRLYLNAYRRGIFGAQIMGVFTRGSCFPRLFLEDPDRECCACSIGRPIREVIWSILHEGGGIPERPQPPDEVDGDNDSELSGGNDDELVGVVEELSEVETPVSRADDEYDTLAALHSKLQHLSFSGAKDHEATALSPSSSVNVGRPSRPKVVTEYIRRGVRVVGENLEVHELCRFFPEYSPGAMPIQLRTTDERLRAFLRALESDIPSIREIASEESRNVYHGGQLISVLALRWVVKTLHTRADAVEDGGRKRERSKEKWTRSEAQAYLACIHGEEMPEEEPQIDDRGIQLTAQILAALEACEWLAQALLLVDLPGTQNNQAEDRLPVLMGVAGKLFSGRRFHSILGRSRPVTNEPFRRLWSAVEEGLEYAFADEKGKRRKKSRSEAIVPSGRKIPNSRIFEVLAGLDPQ